MTKLIPLRRPPSLLTPALRPSAQPHSKSRSSPAASCGGSSSSPRSLLLPTTQCRHATYIARKRHPYFFTQMVQLSDGSTYTVRTTSPHALHRSAKDTRNHTLWQPTEKSLQNVEEDEAGKLAAFRERFGRSFDMSSSSSSATAEEGAEVDAEPAAVAPTAATAAAPAAAAPAGARKSKAVETPAPAGEVEEEEDTLGDLLASYAAKAGVVTRTGATAKEQAKKDRKKGKK